MVRHPPSLKLVTAPTETPLFLEDVKRHLREDSTDQDDLIDMLNAAATEYVENFLGRSLMTQTWDLYLDGFPYPWKSIQIPRGPVISVDGVFYTDSSGEEQDYTASALIDLASEPARVFTLQYGIWPTTARQRNAVRIRFTAGYVDGNSPSSPTVPSAIKAAILLTIGNLYDNRQDVIIGQTAVKLPWGAEQLMRPYRLDLSLA